MPSNTSKNYVYLLIALALAAMMTVLASPGLAQTCTNPSFTQPPIYSVGNDVRSLVAADFDGDGHSDIATANADSNTVSVLTNVGRGFPAGNIEYSVGSFPTGIAAGDFNSDGKADIVTANNSNSNISLLLNNGTGVFVPGGTFSTGGHTPMTVAVGDFNGNGMPDVAVATGSAVLMFLGNGQGGFGAPITTQFAARFLVTADINNDGKLDLAYVSGVVGILLGDGTGHFTGAPCSTGISGTSVAAGDFNADGKIDLVSADVLSAQIRVVLGNGGGCFGSPLNINVSNAGRPTYVAIGDLNNDGKPDIIGGTAVMLGDGAGMFGAPVHYGSGSVGPEPGSNIITSDFDGDGNLDIATAGSGSAGILLGNGFGGFKFASGPAGRGAYGIARGDLNTDGKLDIVVMSFGGPAVMLGDGAGGFGVPYFLPVPFSSSLAGPVISDFNRDTKLDIAVLDYTNNIPPNGDPHLHVLLGNGAGGFGSAISTSIDDNNPWALNGGDFNNDGNPDLLTINRGGGNNNEGSISLALGDGAGHFATPPSLSVRTPSNPRSAGVVDFNGDGKIDLAIPSGFGFSILLGNGSGGFGARTHITTANSASLAVFDFNSDGKADLAMVSEDPNGKLAVVLGDGAGGFGQPSLFNVGVFSGDLTLGDFNGDGKRDIAVANARRNTDINDVLSSISVLFGDGAGGFGVAGHFLADRTPGHIVAGDFNGDRRADIVTANEVVNNLSVFINTCNGPPDPPPILQLSTPTYSIGEGAGSLTVTITRTGDTLGSATVGYATSDNASMNDCNAFNGIASARCDYITSVGTARFAIGESAKTISIPIVDDAYAEGSETFTIALSRPSGATLESPNTATITINDNESMSGPNPIDGTPFFVRQQYLDFLNREPDPAGGAAWQAVINNCPAGDITCDRIHVSSAFFRSAEFQGRGYFVYRFYPVSFGRKPDYVEFMPDLAKVSGFLSDTELEAAKLAFIAEFMNRPAFVAKFGGLNNTQYVDTLLSTAGVAPHQFRDFWIAALGNGTRTRATVLRDIAESPEVYNKYYNQAFVVMQYFGYLRRDPDALYVDWIQVLDTTGDFRGMVNGFMNSNEYRFRFGP